MKKNYDYKAIEDRLKDRCADLEAHVDYKAPKHYGQTSQSVPFFRSDVFKTVMSAAAAIAFIFGLYLLIIRANTFIPPSAADTGKVTGAVTEPAQPIDDEAVIAEAPLSRLPGLLIAYAEKYQDAGTFFAAYGKYADRITAAGYSDSLAAAIIDAWSARSSSGAADEAAARLLCGILVEDNGKSAVGVSGYAGVAPLASALTAAAEKCGIARVAQLCSDGEYTVAEYGEYYGAIYRAAVKVEDSEEGYIERIEYVRSYDVFCEEYPHAAYVLKYITDKNN